MEALAEEAVSLECRREPGKKCPKELHAAPSLIRALHHAWETSPKATKAIASELRHLRKALMKRYAALPLRALPNAERRIIQRLKKST